MPENDDPMWELQQEQACQNNENNQQNTPKPLDNPNTIPDNLTVGEGTQLQEPQPSKIEGKDCNIKSLITIDKQRWYARWYDSGVNAKKKGYTRISPFYLRPATDYFFYCGFDGVKFEDAVLNLDDAMTIQEADLGPEQSQ